MTKYVMNGKNKILRRTMNLVYLIFISQRRSAKCFYLFIRVFTSLCDCPDVIGRDAAFEFEHVDCEWAAIAENKNFCRE